MIRTVVIGAAGRMGRRLVANILESDTLELAGAVEYAESPFLGQDAGAVAGCGNAGVAITADLAGALKGADAVINFATAGVVESTRLAAENGCKTVDFPSISTGVYHFPLDRAAKIAISTIIAVTAAHPEIERVRMVCFDSRTKQAYENALREVRG